MKHILTAAAGILLAISCTNTPEKPVYLDESQPLEARVEDALSRMTLEERWEFFTHSPSSLLQVFHAWESLNYGPQTVLTASVLK